MKRLFILALTAIFAFGITDVCAQHIEKQRVGIYANGSDIVIAEAHTTLAVTFTVEHECFVVGPYARYAQRLLGERAPLVERDEYRIVAAEVMLSDGSHLYEPEAVEEYLVESLPRFSYPLIDRVSSTEVSGEAAAEAAANQIYALRKARLELVTGELGDGGFGAGVSSALREIERLEREYLELFYGKRQITLSHHRYIIDVAEGKSSYVVARFNPSDGLVAWDDLSGDIVLLSIHPGDMEYPASDPKGKISYRFANNADVAVSLAGERIAERVLPIYEFGETILLTQPMK